MNLLKNIYKESLLTDCSIVFENYATPYLPDSVLKISELNLYVDIEFDEPYIGRTGEPIHYLGADNNRNEYFLYNNWIIVRFAEIQIVNTPHDCIKIISSIIDRILQLKNLDFDEIVGDFKLIPQWSKEEAYSLAYEKYRESYLPSEMKANLRSAFKSATILIRGRCDTRLYYMIALQGVATP